MPTPDQKPPRSNQQERGGAHEGLFCCRHARSHPSDADGFCCEKTNSQTSFFTRTCGNGFRKTE